MYRHTPIKVTCRSEVGNLNGEKQTVASKGPEWTPESERESGTGPLERTGKESYGQQIRRRPRGGPPEDSHRESVGCGRGQAFGGYPNTNREMNGETG